MKPLNIILLLLYIGNCFAQNKSDELNLVGNWTLTDYQQNTSDFVLTADNYVSMTINGEFIDGKEFKIRGGKNDGQTGELKYVINYKKNPIEIDIIAIKDSHEKGRILGAITAVNEDEFLMTISFDGKRDLNFNEHNAEKIIRAKRKN